MNRRRRPFNYFKITFLVLLIGFVMYFGVVIGPQVQTSMGPTPTPTRDPESYLTEANQLFEQGKLPQAIQAYQEATRAMPNDASIYISLARTQVWARKYPEAQVSAENALLLNPNNSTAHAVRGWALEFQDDYLSAEASIKRALEIDPNNALAHAYYAELLADQYIQGSGPFDVVQKMSEESNTALKLSPGLLEAHRARGYVFEVTGNSETGNTEKAIDEYLAAVAINKNLADLHLALGRNYRILGIYDKAVESLNRASTLDPTDPTSTLLISRVYTTIGEFTKAEQFAQQSIKISPGITNLHGNLGSIYYRRGKWAQAVDELSLVINGGKTSDGTEVKSYDLNPEIPRAVEFYYTYGLALVKLDRCGDALPLFQKLLSTVPDNEVAVFNANEGIRLCTAAAGATEAPASGTPEAAPSEAPTETPAATPTP